MLFCNICNNLIYFHKIELNTLICNICKNQKKSISDLIFKYKNWNSDTIDKSKNLNITKICLNSSLPIISKFKCTKCHYNQYFFSFKKEKKSIFFYFYCINCDSIYLKKIH